MCQTSKVESGTFIISMFICGAVWQGIGSRLGHGAVAAGQSVQEIWQNSLAVLANSLADIRWMLVQRKQRNETIFRDKRLHHKCWWIGSGKRCRCGVNTVSISVLLTNKKVLSLFCHYNKSDNIILMKKKQ